MQCQWNTASNPIFSGLIPFLWTIFYIFQLNIVYLKVPNAIITGYCVAQSLATPNEHFTQRRIELTSGLCSLNENSITKSFERFNWHAQSWKWQIFKRFCHFLELQRLLQDFWLFRIISICTLCHTGNPFALFHMCIFQVHVFLGFFALFNLFGCMKFSSIQYWNLVPFGCISVCNTMKIEFYEVKIVAIWV